MKTSKIKLCLVTSGCLLLALTGFVMYKLDKREVMPVRLWRVTYERATPKGALFYMRRALVSGDADGYAASFQMGDEDEALRQSLKQMVLAFAKLHRQLVSTYDQVNADMVVRNLAPAVLPEQMIHKAEVSKVGDHILIALGSKETKLVNLELAQSGGAWRVRPETLFPSMSRQAISELMIQFATVIEDIIPEIARGKYANAYDVQLAIKHAMN